MVIQRSNAIAFRGCFIHDPEVSTRLPFQEYSEFTNKWIYIYIIYIYIIYIYIYIYIHSACFKGLSVLFLHQFHQSCLNNCSDNVRTVQVVNGGNVDVHGDISWTVVDLSPSKAAYTDCETLLSRSNSKRRRLQMALIVCLVIIVCLGEFLPRTHPEEIKVAKILKTIIWWPEGEARLLTMNRRPRQLEAIERTTKRGRKRIERKKSRKNRAHLARVCLLSGEQVKQKKNTTKEQTIWISRKLTDSKEYIWSEEMRN